MDLTEKDFLDIYQKVPRICVEIILSSKKGILLTKRKIPPCKGKWHFPGGGVKINETLRLAVKRIAKEEINLKVKVKKLLGVIEYSKKNKLGRKDISLAFLVKRSSGIIKTDYQSSEAKFFKNAPKDMIPAQKRFFKRISGMRTLLSF